MSGARRCVGPVGGSLKKVIPFFYKATLYGVAFFQSRKQAVIASGSLQFVVGGMTYSTLRFENRP